MNAAPQKVVFPDPMKEAAERAREFRAISHEERMWSIRDVLRTGVAMLERSPKRALVDAIFQEREDEWQRIQKDLFARQADHVQ